VSVFGPPDAIVPEDLRLPHWSWDGPVEEEPSA
jgi:hypothetical protein